MSLFVKRGLVFALGAVLLGLGSVALWPGDSDSGLTLGHWVSLAGFFLAASFVAVAAASLFLGVIGSAWEVEDFDVNEYLDDLK